MFKATHRWKSAPFGVSLALGVLVASLGVGSLAPEAGAAKAAFPVAVHTSEGVVQVAQRPTAIVSLSPTATEMLYSIGAGSQVKAVDSYSDYPKNAPRTKLNAFQPNVEAIVAYKPDLVIASQDQGLVAALGKFDIPVIVDPAATTLQSAYEQFIELGEATGHVSAAKAEVAKIKTQLHSIVQSVGTHPTYTYYFELEQDYFSVTSSTFIGQLLDLVGLKSIADAASGAASSGGYPQLSAEFIIKSNPNYIFLADTLCCHQSAKSVAARPGWAALSAVKDHRVVPLNDDIASRWGPRIVNLLRTIANAIRAHHP
jgi:iron complex transport system substrate-binding protein